VVRSRLSSVASFLRQPAGTTYCNRNSAPAQGQVKLVAGRPGRERATRNHRKLSTLKACDALGRSKSQTPRYTYPKTLTPPSSKRLMYTERTRRLGRVATYSLMLTNHQSIPPPYSRGGVHCTYTGESSSRALGLVDTLIRTAPQPSR